MHSVARRRPASLMMMAVVLATMATSCYAQLAPDSPETCPFEAFTDRVTSIDVTCCGIGTNNTEPGCTGGQPPSTCSLTCAKAYVPFYDNCADTIDVLFDTRDGTADGHATGFAELYNTCLDYEMIDVDMLLDNIRELRADGCTVDLSETEGVSTETEDPTVVGGGHQRLLQGFLSIGGGRGRAEGCADMVALQARVDEMNAACCTDAERCPEGTPLICDPECALVFIPFDEECEIMLRAAMDREVIRKLHKVKERCADIPTAPVINAIVDAYCPSCGNGIIDGEEECDLGEANSEDPNSGCRTNCLLPQCGDGIVDDAAPHSEQCDPPGEDLGCFDDCTTDLCHGITCSGHGTCTRGVCICQDGSYTGENCEHYDPCWGVDCHHGTCSGGSCTCSSGYKGSTCNTRCRTSHYSGACRERGGHDGDCCARTGQASCSSGYTYTRGSGCGFLCGSCHHTICHETC